MKRFSSIRTSSGIPGQTRLCFAQFQRQKIRQLRNVNFKLIEGLIEEGNGGSLNHVSFLRKSLNQKTLQLAKSTDRSTDRRLLLFDLSIRGHHPNYIQQLIRYWNDKQVPGHLEIVVSPKFLEEHADVVALSTRLERRDIRFTTITPEEEANLSSRKLLLNRVKRSFQEIKLLAKYATTIGANHCLLMYFDTFQIPLAIGLKLPCPFSGIYFRPTFHYRELIHHQQSWKERLQRWWERLILSRILRHGCCHLLFCLDPFAVKHLQRQGEMQVMYLPDPVTPHPVTPVKVQTLATSLGMEPRRQVFLLFGALTERKGIHELLDAIALLPPNLARHFCLLLVGEINPSEKQVIEAKIFTLHQALPVQIITQYEFVSDEEMHTYFHLADVVLAPYQRHVGMSGILLLAAAAQKPVLSSDFGLMGELVQVYQLGITVDTTIPAQIAQALTRFLIEQPETFGDREKMYQFAQQNAAEHYACVIFEHL